MKRKVLVGSLLSILMSLGVVVGGTFAVFTSEAETNIAVSSGKVEVVAEVTGLETYSRDVKQADGKFANGGTAKYENGVVNLALLTPGDKAVFTIDVKNNSTVATKFRTKVQLLSGEKLFSGLNVTIDGEKYDGLEKTSEWATAAEGALLSVKVEVELPYNAGNDYQNLETSFTYQVQAVQANGDYADYYVSTVDDLKDAVAKGGDVALMSSLSLDEGVKIEIKEGQKVTLNLNGHTIEGGFQAGSTEKHVYTIENHGTLVLSGNGTINGRGVGNYGDLTINSGTYNAIDTNGGGAIWNYAGGEVVVNGGTFTAADDDVAPGAVCLNNAKGATAIINNATFISGADQTYGIINNGDLTINDIEVSSDHGIISSNGTTELNGGTYIQNGTLNQTSAGVYVYGGTTTINGGTFNHNVAGNLDSGHVVTAQGGEVIINDGTFTGGVAGVLGLYSSNSKIDVIAGLFSGDVSKFVNAESVILPKEQENGEIWYKVINSTPVADASNLNNLLSGSVVEAKIVLDSTVDYGTTPFAITGSLKDVTIDANSANAFFTVPAGAVLENVTFTNLNSGDGALRTIDIAANTTVKNLVIENSKLADLAAAPYGAIYSANPNAEITVRNTVFDGCRYAIYGSTPATKLTFENCEFKNFSSWVIMLNGSDTVGAQLTINNCYFENCKDGIAKYLGSSQPDGAFTVFTNNTLVNCAGHDGVDSKWFTIPGATSTITVSNNTLDGVEWVPGTAQGLGK